MKRLAALIGAILVRGATSAPVVAHIVRPFGGPSRPPRGSSPLSRAPGRVPGCPGAQVPPGRWRWRRSGVRAVPTAITRGSYNPLPR